MYSSSNHGWAFGILWVAQKVELVVETIISLWSIPLLFCVFDMSFNLLFPNTANATLLCSLPR